VSLVLLARLIAAAESAKCDCECAAGSIWPKGVTLRALVALTRLLRGPESGVPRQGAVF